MKSQMKELLAVGALVFAIDASAVTDWNVAYFPTTETGPWNWTTQAAWIRNWSPWAHAALGSLPYYGSTVIHTVNLYHNKLATSPLVLPSGTDAKVNGFWIGGGTMEEPGVGTTSPIKFEIDGGSLTVNNISYIGYYHTSLDGGAHTATRSGEITIKNGGILTAKKDFYLGFGFADSVLDIQNGRFDALANINVGGGWQARGILTNGVNGVITAPAIQLAVDTSTTGLVHNAGTITAGVVQLGIKGGQAVSRFDNYGTLTVTNYLCLGISQWAAESVYVHHPGAKLVKNNEEPYYVGYNGPGRFVVDGGALTNSVQKSRFFVGFKNNHYGRGALDVINGGSFYNKDRVVAGYPTGAEGTVTISNNASFHVNSAFHVGNAPGIWSGQTDGWGSVLVDDNSVLQCGQLRLGDSTGAYGELTVSGGSVVRRAYSGAQVYIGASQTGCGTGVVSVVGVDSVISNFDVIGIASLADRNSGTLTLKGGTVVCKGNNAESFVLGYYTNTTTTAANRSVATVCGYGTIRRDNPADSAKRAYMKYYGKVIADGQGDERDLDLHTMSALVQSSTNATEAVNFTGEDGWYAVNKGRLRLPHGDKVSDWRQRTIGDYSWLGDGLQPRLVNAVKIAFQGSCISSTPPGEGPCYFHVDLYAPDRTDIPAGLTDKLEQDEITAVYRMGCFDGVDDDSRGHVLNWPTITFHYAKPGYDGYETQNVKLYWYNETTSTWQLENAAAYNASSPYIATVNSHHGATDKAWNLGWYAVTVPKKKGSVLILR